MSESLRMWVEIGFNVTYLVVVWGLVITMARNKSRVAPDQSREASLVIWAFALLALGDTGHVGFRVLAYAAGGLESQNTILGLSTGTLVGLGALATAVTVTFFYVLVLELWRVHFNRRYGPFEIVLLAAAVVRLFIMMLPANAWSSVVPPQPISTLRNLPLVLQGLGAAYLILRDARKTGDRIFTWIGISICISYACYIPVILFVQQAPLVGMLMIPKTMAYVAIGFLAYRAYFSTPMDFQTGKLERPSAKSI